MSKAFRERLSFLPFRNASHLFFFLFLFGPSRNVPGFLSFEKGRRRGKEEEWRKRRENEGESSTPFFCYFLWYHSSSLPWTRERTARDR